MRKNIWKKIAFSVFAGTCALCINAMSTKAAAYTCESNGTKYESIEDAVSAVAENGTADIKMLSDETMTACVKVRDNKNVTLDLAGHHIEYLDCDQYAGIQVVSGKLTLNDSVGTGTISVGNTRYGMILVTGGEFVMNGGAIVHHENSVDSEIGIEGDRGSVIINGGTIQTRTPLFCGANSRDTANLEINGGKFIGEGGCYVLRNITATINGGYFLATDSYEDAFVILMTPEGSSGKLPRATISGGEFHGDRSGICIANTQYLSAYKYRLKDVLADGCILSDTTEIEGYNYQIFSAKDVAVYREATDSTITVNGITDAVYTGEPIIQNPVVSWKGITLVNGKDYTLSYSNNINVGTATMFITFCKPYVGSVNKIFQITGNDINVGKQEAVIKKGNIITTKTAVYKVTKYTQKTKTVEYVRPVNKKVKSASIPATIKADGITYKVTSIAKNALKNNKKITKVTIGKNVSKIGKQAFYGCKKLKNITIKTKKLTKKNVGSKAFKGTPKSAKVKVPKSKYKAYKKLLVSKGISKKAKFTK